MSNGKLRPTFSIPTQLSAKQMTERVRKAVVRQSDDLQGQFTTDHAVVSIIESKRHFWSPWLNLEVRSSEDEQIVFGRFSPHPSIWTGFMFTYLALGVAFFFSAIVGMTQQLLGTAPWGYGLLPVWIACAIGLWFASQAGQKLATYEMERMKESVEQAVATKAFEATEAFDELQAP